MSRGVGSARGACSSPLIAPTTPRVATRARGGLQAKVAGGDFQGRMWGPARVLGWSRIQHGAVGTAKDLRLLLRLCEPWVGYRLDRLGPDASGREPGA